MTQLVDYNYSLINYLLNEPGVYSYVKKSGNETIKTDKVFVYMNINRNAYNTIIEQRYLGTLSETGFSLPFNRPEKQVIPPNWSRGDIYKIQKLIDDPEVKFIAFPIQLLGQYTRRTDPKVANVKDADSYVSSKTKKYKPTNEGSHSLVLLYNKQTSNIDVLDYDYGIVKIYFNYEGFIDNDLKFYMTPILETFGLKLNKIILPKIYTNRFGILKDIVTEAELPNDYSVLYKVFLATYIHMRTEDIASKSSDLANKVVPHKSAPKSSIHFLINMYIHMSETIGENPYVSKYIPTTAEGSTFDFSKPCPEKFVRDFKTGECIEMEKEIQNKLKVIEAHPTGKHFYPEHSSKWLTLIFRYWNDKYENLAILIPKHTYSPHPYYYALQYNYKPRRHSATTHMHFMIPPDFYEFIDFSMNDSNKRFIALIVGIDFQGKHANPIIIDKVHRTVERIEVNAPFMDYRYGYNDKTLDEQLLEFFEKDENLKDYNLKYIPALATCPFALHRTEYSEPSFEVTDIGGRCAEWTLFYIELRVSNPSIDRDKLYSYALEKIKKLGSAKHFIHGYMDNIVKQARKFKIKDYNRTQHPILSISVKERNQRLSAFKKGHIAVISDVLPPIPKIKAKSEPTIIIPTLDIFEKSLKKRTVASI
jgi:hypothetical protein